MRLPLVTFGKASFTSALLGCASVAVSIVISFFANGIDTSSLATDVKTAQRDGRFPISTDRPTEWHDLRRHGLHVYRECRMYGTAIRHREEDFMAQAITPLEFGNPPDLGVRIRPCEGLLLFTNGDFPERWGGFRRHRYLHGLHPIVIVGSKIFGMDGFRQIVVSATYLLAFLVVLGCTRRWAKTKHPQRVREGSSPKGVEPLLLLVLFWVFFVSAGIPFHAKTVSHGVPNLILLGLLALVALMSLRSLRPRRLIFGSAVMGVTLVHLDYMIGATPLGLAILLAMVSLEHADVESWRRVAVRMLGAGTAFVSGAMATILSKQIVAYLYFGPDVWQALLSQLAKRSGYSQYTFTEAVNRIGDASRYLAFGNEVVGDLALRVSLVALLVPLLAAMTLRLSAVAKRQLKMLTLSNGVIIVWYFVFWDHAVQHAYFMISLMAWPAAVGATSVIIAAMDLDWFPSHAFSRGNRERR